MIEVAYNFTDTDGFGNTFHHLNITFVNPFAYKQGQSNNSSIENITSVMMLGEGSGTELVRIFNSSTTEYLSIPKVQAWLGGAFIEISILDLPFRVKIPPGIPFVGGSIPTGMMIGFLDTDSVDIVNRYIPGSTSVRNVIRAVMNRGGMGVGQASAFVRIYYDAVDFNGDYAAAQISNIISLDDLQKETSATLGETGIPLHGGPRIRYSASSSLYSSAPMQMEPAGVAGSAVAQINGYLIGYNNVAGTKYRLRTGNVMCADGSFDLGGESTSANVLHDPTL